MADPHDKAILEAVGQELRRLRRAKGWSRPDFIALLSPTMPVNTYSCYEQGIRPCPLPRLVDICRALDVRVGDLIETALQRLVDPPGDEPVRPVRGTADPDLQDLQESLDRIEGTLAAGYARILRTLHGHGYPEGR